MDNIAVQTLGISQDAKMTRIYLVAQVNFFGTNEEKDDNSDDDYSEELEC
jgi:hypothetical protein